MTVKKLPKMDEPFFFSDFGSEVFETEEGERLGVDLFEGRDILTVPIFPGLVTEISFFDGSAMQGTPKSASSDRDGGGDGRK